MKRDTVAIITLYDKETGQKLGEFAKRMEYRIPWHIVLALPVALILFMLIEGSR